ncbi:Uncharacterised protein [Mycobacteroides abscessus subsp. abscessus]|nr:Uncharacterised protein [Mycobacteroides abscessus subsp. abscessus]
MALFPASFKLTAWSFTSLLRINQIGYPPFFVISILASLPVFGSWTETL